MHKIKSIVVTGYRRQEEPINLVLGEHANFLIGQNGTGKTTLINLINACLTVDYRVLTETIFEKVIISFKRTGENSVPSIEVKKPIRQKREALVEVRYKIKGNAKADPEKYNLLLEKHRTTIHGRGSNRQIVFRRDNVRELHHALSSIFNHTWLSLHRGHEKIADYHSYELEYENVGPAILPGVDRKLDEVLRKLQEYYFTLDGLVKEKTHQFQQEWFRSFLISGDFPDIRNTHIDFDAERKAIDDIFKRFEVQPESYEGQLKNHIAIGKEVFAKFRKRGIRLPEFYKLYDVFRLHMLVNRWQLLQKEQGEILAPKSEFVGIASSMLYRKTIDFTPTNDVKVNADDNLNIPVEKLSSGEKQLLIFLAETLLQQKQPYIFLADEPELSLHVEWQEKLVLNLLQMNPNAQVLFATHSPDIVGPFREHVFSMEKLVK